MVHPDVNIDDEIFFLKGCTMLVVLRKCSGVYNDRYRVIGGGVFQIFQNSEQYQEV
jgi:hypothetical protein